ncbi:hypothetical protein N0V90_012720 [Kalmusia sp. IMI 367209]|nr:hypothetical protein N0V90_012720 [Kalmusia sp. IMI 367209]
MESRDAGEAPKLATLRPERNSIVPPYWQRHERNDSRLSCNSVDARPSPIRLEDHTDEGSEQCKALWARHPPQDALKADASITKQPSRASARKRSTDEVDSGDARAPKQRRIHGEPLVTPNGITKSLGKQVDHVSSTASTPRAVGTSPAAGPEQTSSAMADKMVLREPKKDPLSKSDIRRIFEYYPFDVQTPKVPPASISDNEPILIEDEEEDDGGDDEPVKGPEVQNAPTSPSTRKSTSPNRSRKSQQAPTSTRKAAQPSVSASSAQPAFQALDYSTDAKHLSDNDTNDPLADSMYEEAHKKMEKKENKGTFNLAREVINNEQLAKSLLKGLEGSDWLTVMDIPSVKRTGSDVWQPKRRHWINELRTYIESGRLYKEREKKLKAKEAAQTAENEGESQKSNSRPRRRKVNGKAPVPSRSRLKESEHSKSRRPPQPRGYLLPFDPVAYAKPFETFFKTKKAKREAMSLLAAGKDGDVFGVPLPFKLRGQKRRRSQFDDDVKFILPKDLRTEEFERVNARQRRRLRRKTATQS